MDSLNKMKDLSLCVLSRNEEKNIRRVVKELTEVFEKNKVDFEIVAVSNNSSDNTVEILKDIKKKNKYLKIVNTPKQIGYGYAVRVGLQNCKGKFIGYVDGDNQASAEDIFKVYEKISSDNSISLCKARRASREDPIIRLIISKVYNILFRLLFKVNLKDMNACPKIMRFEDYKKINLTQNNWFTDAELIIKLDYLKKKIVEIPIVYSKREEGVSNIKWTTVFEFLRDIFIYRFNTAKWKNQVKKD